MHTHAEAHGDTVYIKTHTQMETDGKTHSYFLRLPLSLFFLLTLTHILSHSPTYSHTHSHTHTHTCAHTQTY